MTRPAAAVPGSASGACAVAAAALRLRDECGALRFEPPVAFVYNPLAYAWEPHLDYLSRYGGAPKRVVFVGMNPGPWGMAQVGVPFGEISAVRDWLGIRGRIDPPATVHPKRPVDGFSCTRSEVSGRRLWGLFARRFGSAEAFFKEHLVLNYCPLMFLEESGRNLTPDKLPRRELDLLTAACDRGLTQAVATLQAEWVVGVGRFACDRARTALAGAGVKVGTVLHPSPASPRANRGWAEAAEAQLTELGIWA